MNTNHTNAEKIKSALRKLLGVEFVNEIKIKDKIIEYISLENRAIGRLMVQRLKVEDSPALFDFYFRGLSEESRNFFPPYPLFSPSPNSVEELSNRIIEWKKEDDWTFLNLMKDGQIIGVCLLKRYQPERPTSGLAVREEFQKIGLGVMLQTIVNQQAILLGLKRVCATVAPDNAASLRIHEKCGFKRTGRTVAHYGYKNGIKEFERFDIEMFREFD